MRRPLLLFAFSLALSLAVLQFAPPAVSLFVCAACAAASLVIILFFKKAAIGRPYFIILFALFFSGGLLYLWGHAYIEPVYYFDGRPSHITGYICDLESKTNYGYKYTLKCETIESGGVSYSRPFDVALYTNAPLKAKPYERITLTAVTSLPREADEGRDMDTRAFLRSKGVYLEAALKSERLLKETGEVCGNAFLRGALDLKRHVTDSLLKDGVMSPENAALAAAVTTNYKGRLSQHQKEVFASVGLSHMTAASGMHLSILVFSVLLLFRMAGVRRKYALIAALCVVVGFAAVAGFSVSVVRAGVMFFVMSLAFIFGRSYDSYTSLGLAAVCILFQNPYAIGDAGFVLSASSTLGILLFSGKLARVLTIKKKGAFFAVLNYLLGIICVTLSATALSAPFSMFIFGGLSLAAPVSNLLAAPLLPVIFVLTALSAALYTTPAAHIVLYMLDGVCTYISGMSGALSRLPYAYLATKGDEYYIWLAFAAAVVMTAYASWGKIKARHAVCMILSSLLFVGVFAGPAVPPRESDEGFRLTALYVGQGQCLILESEDKTFVFDCGTSTYGEDAGQTAAEYLKRNGTRRIDALVLSHYHDDHANGAARLMSNIKTDMLVIPAWGDDEGVMEGLVRTADELGTDVYTVAGDCTLSAGGLALHIYADYMYDRGEDEAKDYNANEKNLAVLAQYGESRALIEGDITGEDEGYLSETEDMETDVLVAAHHGSKYSSYADFLNIATPDIAVISAGRGNSYGHPSEETLDRFERLGAQVWRTDTDGNVVIDTRGDGNFSVYQRKK